jgi:prophage regulatory protein
MSRSLAKRFPIVGTAELEVLLNVSPARVFQLVVRPDFPDPWARVRAGRMWRTEDIQAWAKAEGRALHPLPPDWPPARNPGPPKKRGDAAPRPKTDTSP